MASKPYQDRLLLHELYVKKRMTMTSIQKYFEDKYGCVVSSQTIYNYLKKYDLLKYRGKGRRNVVGKKPVLSPMAMRAQQIKREQRRRMKNRLG